jgi:hypothetical protein
MPCVQEHQALEEKSCRNKNRVSRKSPKFKRKTDDRTLRVPVPSFAKRAPVRGKTLKYRRSRNNYKMWGGGNRRLYSSDREVNWEMWRASYIIEEAKRLARKCIEKEFADYEGRSIYSGLTEDRKELFIKLDKRDIRRMIEDINKITIIEVLEHVRDTIKNMRQNKDIKNCESLSTIFDEHVNPRLNQLYEEDNNQISKGRNEFFNYVKLLADMYWSNRSSDTTQEFEDLLNEIDIIIKKSSIEFLELLREMLYGYGEKLNESVIPFLIILKINGWIKYKTEKINSRAKSSLAGT